MSVTIRTLTVGRRQVTLNLFRQLQDESLVDTVGGLAGIPWGIVNYHGTRDCPRYPRDPAHLHVVWQKGDELRRAVATPPVPADNWVDVGLADALVALGRPVETYRPSMLEVSLEAKVHLPPPADHRHTALDVLAPLVVRVPVSALVAETLQYLDSYRRAAGMPPDYVARRKAEYEDVRRQLVL